MKRTLAVFLAVAAALLVVVALPTHQSSSLPAGTTADRVMVDKSERTLSIYHDSNLLKTYKVALGREPHGPKRQEGDGRTPEGNYVIDFHKRDSSFHRALHISYP